MVNLVRMVVHYEHFNIMGTGVLGELF